VVSRWFLAVPAVAMLAWVLVVACEPSLNETTFGVASPRILAVRSELVGDGGAPTDFAEVNDQSGAGGSVSLTALYVGANGPIDGGPFDWAFCLARNPLANLGPVNPSCAQASGPASVFQELNVGNPRASSVTALIPANGCNNFGPEVPMIVISDAGDGGQSPGRPVDPDSTGGYYQPVRLVAGDQIAMAFVRIYCGPPPGATSSQQGPLATPATVANSNPAINSVVDLTNGSSALHEEGQGTNSVTASKELDLRANWATCDPDASTCTGSQQYALLDPLTFDVVQVHEQMRVSWFSTAGTFTNDTTAPDGGSTVAYADNTWTAPTTAQAAPVYMWVVLRDDRGGVGWVSYVFNVK
jgi:hypothetical protein